MQQPLTLSHVLQVEADLGYPGGKAKVIHKESDMIMAFSINKVNIGVSVNSVLLFSGIAQIIVLPLLHRQTVMKLFWLQHTMFKNLMSLLYWLVNRIYGLEKNMTESRKGVAPEG